MGGDSTQRFLLYTQLATCPLAGWYARLTGDVRTAAQFERVRERMLARLAQGEPQQQESAEPVAVAAAPVEQVAGAGSGYQQLALL